MKRECRQQMHTCAHKHTYLEMPMHTNEKKHMHCRFTRICNPHTIFHRGMQTHGCMLGNVMCTQPGVCEQVQWIKLKGFDDWGSLNTCTVILFTLLVKQTCDKHTQSDGYTVHYWGQSTSATVSDSCGVKRAVVHFLSFLQCKNETMSKSLT